MKMFFKQTPQQMAQQQFDETNRSLITYTGQLEQVQQHVAALKNRRDWLRSAIVSGEFNQPEITLKNEQNLNTR